MSRIRTHILLACLGTGVLTSGLGAQVDPSRNALLVPGVGGLPGTSAEAALFGAAVVAGDFNGDGRADLAVGSPGATVSDIVGTGEVTITYGSAVGIVTAGAQTLAIEDFSIGLAQLDERFGAALASADFDGDGFADLAIGVPWRGMFGAPPTAWRNGFVVVVFGSPGGLDPNNFQLLRHGLDGLPGAPEDNEFFGETLAAGDFDGDGFADLVVATPGQDWAGQTAAGMVMVVPGGALGLQTALATPWTQGMIGLELDDDDDRFGSTLEVADWNDDGFDDLAIGTPLDDVLGAPSAGSVTVLYGSTGGVSVVGVQRWTEQVLGSFGPEELFGRSLAAEDFNGDGIVDLAIGVPGKNLVLGGPPIPKVGSVVLLPGSVAGGLQAEPVVLERASVDGQSPPNGFFGWGLEGIRFGLGSEASLVVGLPGATVDGAAHAGVAFVLSDIWSGEPGLDTTLRQGGSSPGIPGANELFGTVLTAADFDGDGAGDLAVGVPLDTVAGNAFAGVVHLFYGTAMLFADGFESGSTAAWSAAVGE